MFLSVNELIGLPGLPGTAQGLRLALKKRADNSPDLVRKRQGSKAFEYHIDCLPEAARAAATERHYKSVLEQSGCQTTEPPVKRAVAIKPRQELELMRQCPALIEREVCGLTDDQKAIADARALLASEVERLRNAGLSRLSAVNYIVGGSRDGSLPENLMAAADLANARKGSRVGISRSSLQEWVSIFQATQPGLERLAMLAPGQNKRKKPEDASWFYGMFWPHYANRNGPSVREAYRSFRREWHEVYHAEPAMRKAIPSYYAVLRRVNQLPLCSRVQGRVSGSAKKAYEVYSKRDWAQMPVNGIWISDGKSMDMKVAHPIHGRPFTPELTMVIDGRTRFVVGWSLSLSENAMGVADAYRFGMKHFGKPLFVYSDNGGGQKNKMLDADITGIFPRLGIEHMTGIPGNPQARGIIERLNAVIPERIAKRTMTYNGRSVDPNAARIQGKNLISLSDALRNGNELTTQQQRTFRDLPSWQWLMDAVQDEIDNYNNHHEHSELPKVDGTHMTPAAYRAQVLQQEGDEIEYITEGELREMFMPEVERVAQRGWVSVGNNQYFSKDLIEVDRQSVRVGMDIHDPEAVIIRQMDGTYVCTAIWNGNSHSPVPQSRVEQAKEKRAKRMIKRAGKIIQDANDELRPVLEVQRNDFSSLFVDTAPRDNKPLFLLETEREEYFKKTNSR
ncbi:Mu transposase C-terminal domain-containing protein [Serratia marcescens]|uniref:Mu transposase C-terminal domain-containing protein n=1 Tax=Serratia nevei TaxID=2703794 RepID=UPI001D26D174|nr:transposase [Serratia marcescens]